MNKAFYKKKDAIIIAYSIDDRNSFEKVQTWIDSINENAENKPQLMLLGLKSDLQDDRAVSYNEGKELA